MRYSTIAIFTRTSPFSIMKSLTTLFKFSTYVGALSLIATLAACGGGGDNSSSGGNTSPKPNPITVAPTLNCSTDGIAASTASTATVTVCMLTSDGEIVIALDPAKAPITVTNFQQYVNSGFYSNTIFHRVVPGFVVQGGGYTTGYVVKANSKLPIALESQNGLSNLRGTIAMARTDVPASATSQFFFNTVDNLNLNYSSSTSPGYAVFGKVISGSATIDKINAETQLYASAETPATEVLLYWAKQLKPAP